MDTLGAAGTAGAGAVAYLVGSIPVGYLIGRARGVDVRTQGSGNIGATNVARTVGRTLGVLVLILDAIKGALPVAILHSTQVGAAIARDGRSAPYLITVIGFASIVGHCFPIWLRFRGGKGVATALGVFLVADPLAVVIGAGVFAVLYLALRIVSIGSLAASVTIPTAMVILGRPAPLLALALGAAVLVIAKHHQNIRRILKRSELKV